MTMTKYANDVIAGITRVEALDCPRCGLVFGIDDRFIQRRRDDARDFYCPNGHPMSFRNTDLQDAQQRIAALERYRDSLTARLTHERDQRGAAERSARAYKGQVTKIKRRVGNGVCPCCNRSFADLARHMEGQHPEYAGGDHA